MASLRISAVARLLVLLEERSSIDERACALHMQVRTYTKPYGSGDFSTAAEYAHRIGQTFWMFALQPGAGMHQMGEPDEMDEE